ncbi:PEP-CTERM sorting domain-containing protein [Rhodoferax sp. PAMC 29310]|uniref:PEP-CTERM sorting domain-containing protein n=1 Tax=Rhodoferax sp. PAMC 29310 TaxID=2822760 RepID=UPI00351CC245
MLADSNGRGNFTPDTIGGAAQNVVGSGSALLVIPNTVPEPAMLALMIAGLCALSHVTYLRRRYLC